MERLLWVVENFFVLDVPHHELGLYYLVSLPPESGLLDVSATFAGQEEYVPLFFRWFPVADLAELPLYPVFLRGCATIRSRHHPAHHQPRQPAGGRQQLALQPGQRGHGCVDHRFNRMWTSPSASASSTKPQA